MASGTAVASMRTGPKDSREPVVIVEGVQRFVSEEDGPGAAALLRPLEEDLFR